MTHPPMRHLNNPQRGQALVEYVLILVLLAVALAFAVAATGPAIGNVFCNVVDNLAGSESADICGRNAELLVARGGAPVDFWATVTWVAGNPQQETPFPTPLRQPPTSFISGVFETNTPSPTPSNTPSHTPSHTPSATLTPSQTLTPTIGASPTPSDIAFAVPHVDQIHRPEWWRLGTEGFWLGSIGETWSAQFYNGASASNWTTLNLTTIPTLSSPVGSTTYVSSDLSFNWGTTPGFPSGVGITDGETWGAIFTRTFNLASAEEVIITLQADNYARLRINGTNIMFALHPNPTSQTITLSPGANTFEILYAENTGGASFSFSVRRPRVNQDDSVANCPWGQVNSAANSASTPFQFENVAVGGWTSGATCYLELRGYIDTAGIANPVLSFWDVWDFSGGGVTAQLQVAEYITDAGGAFNRAAASWTNISLHGAFTANHNWTRHEIPLDPYRGASNRVIFRFRLTGPGTAPFRWHIDDIKVVNEPTPPGFFSVRDTWNLNNRSQMADFIFNADTNFTIEQFSLSPDTRTSPYRWDLTSTRRRGTTGFAWDQSPGGSYVAHPNGDRIYSLEFKKLINLAIAPTQDLEMDTGDPLLTFWMAYDVPVGSSLRVEYSTDPRGATPSTWTVVPNGGLLLNYTIPGTPGPNEFSARSSTSMQFVSINLTNIPTQIFRLRFALIVQPTATLGDGWYIDDISIERENPSPFFAYPFYDDAESTTQFANYWRNLSETWAQSNSLPAIANANTLAAVSPGALNTAFHYTDSPGGNYPTNTTLSLELRSYIDLMRDTPGNTEPARLPASEPLLTFWHRRQVGNNVILRVEMQNRQSSIWWNIWEYNSATHATTLRRQDAWERIEINLRTALEGVTGKTWAQIADNIDGFVNDDDIRIRFSFVTDGASQDGVYLDEISIANANYRNWRLWPIGSGGEGMFVENVESLTGPFDLGLPTWAERWRRGGIWSATTARPRNGSLSFDVGPGAAEYIPRARQVLELTPVIDLTNTPATDPVYLHFWMTYDIGASPHQLRVEVSQADSSTTQYYNKTGGWTEWTPRAYTIGGQNNATSLGDNVRVDSWGRGQVDLTSFRGSRIRVRFILDTANNDADRDIYIDLISVTHGRRNIPLPFIDETSTTTNWVLEGNWGLTQQFFTGVGSSADDLGGNQWVGWLYDCQNLIPIGGSGCGTSNATTIVTNYPTNPPLVNCAVQNLNPNFPVGPDCRDDINFFGGRFIPASPNNFDDGFVARYTRQVVLQPGATYIVRTVSDDGIRVWIDNVAGTTVSPFGGGPRGRIIDNWTDHSPTVDTAVITVTSGVPITRTISVEFYENTGGEVLSVAISRFNYSFTDSPNTGSLTTWTTVNSLQRGDSAMILDGFFNFTGRANPTLTYQTLYTLGSQTTLRVETSTDGGMTWVERDTIWAGSTRTLTAGWQLRSVNLSAIGNQPNVQIRFRLDARGATTAGEVSDGIYIADIRVN